MDSWGDQVAEFKRRVDSIGTMVILATWALGAYAGSLNKKVAALVASGQVDKQTSDDGKSATYLFSELDSPDIRQSLDVCVAAARLMPSGIVSLVTDFEQLTGGLIKTVLTLRPEIWQSCEESKLAYSEAVAYPSIEALKESLLNRTVEAVLRNGGPSQFRWLESKLGVTLTKDLEEWIPYVELTERRNLLMHSDGCVTDQYIRACQAVGLTWTSKPSIGEQLSMGPDYFLEACTLVLTLGVKLTHVLWRKISPQETELADSNLANIIFDSVKTEKYDAAERLGVFALDTLKKHPDEKVLRMILVNTAQAYKWDGKPEKCRSLLDSRDWRASSDDFKLAVAVLRDDYATVVRLMRQLGKSSEMVTEEAYKTWPLFREERKRDDFLAAYAEVFGQVLKVEQSLPTLWHQVTHEPQAPTADIPEPTADG